MRSLAIDSAARLGGIHSLDFNPDSESSLLFSCPKEHLGSLEFGLLTLV